MAAAAATSLCPVIINASLSQAGFLDYLGNGFKIRLSNSTPKDSIILPSCGLAALVIDKSKISVPDLPQVPKGLSKAAGDDAAAGSKVKGTASSSQRKGQVKKELRWEGMNDNGERKREEKESLENLISRVEAFQRCHRIGLILLVGSVFCADEVGGRVMFRLQMSLMPSPPPILPAHGDAQIAAHIQTLAKVCKPENHEVLQARMSEIKSRALKRDHNFSMGREMGLNTRQALALMDSFGSIENVAKASATDIHQQTSLDEATAASVAAFLDIDKMSL